MSKHPPKSYKSTQTHCNKRLVWIDCGHRASTGCPDCLGAGGWWQECLVCGYQPYKNSELLKSKKKKG